MRPGAVLRRPPRHMHRTPHRAIDFLMPEKTRMADSERLLIGAGGLRPFALGGSKCKPVGSYFIPPLYQKAVRLEELTDSGSLPAYNFLQDRHKYGQRIGA